MLSHIYFTLSGGGIALYWGISGLARPLDAGMVLDAYLDARYYCTALAAVARRVGDRGLAARLGAALDSLCKEIRGLMAAAGLSRVPRRFDPGLLSLPVEVLRGRCAEAAGRAAGLGSAAAGAILRALELQDAGGGG